MSRVYRAMEEGTRPTEDGSRLVYVLGQIAKVLELTEIEARLRLLESWNTTGNHLLPQGGNHQKEPT